MLFVIFPFNFCQFDHCASRCVPPQFYPAWNSLSFLDLVDCFLSHAGKVPIIISSNIFLSTFSLLLLGPHIGNVGVFNIIPEVSQVIFISFHPFSIFCFVAVISIFLPGCLSVLLSQLFCQLFLLVYCSSVCLSFSSSRSLGNISCISSILFPRSWVVFTTIILNSFSGRLPVSLHLVVFLGFYFVPSSGM